MRGILRSAGLRHGAIGRLAHRMISYRRGDGDDLIGAIGAGLLAAVVDCLGAPGDAGGWARPCGWMGGCPICRLSPMGWLDCYSDLLADAAPWPHADLPLGMAMLSRLISDAIILMLISGSLRWSSFF